MVSPDQERVFDVYARALENVRRIREGKEKPVASYKAPDPQEIREGLGLSQSEFATILGVSVRTLQNWEQGRRIPTGPAAMLLRIADRHPEAVLDTRAHLPIF
ncbi:MAG: helix-turn-helix domain-containing protein [Trueperaceae bacterium]|nr:helix-turn-helix domain-containing protein [Trueperaceae bacterium]